MDSLRGGGLFSYAISVWSRYSKIHHYSEETDIDKQVSILIDLNLSLPLSKRLPLQSVFTDDYVERMLSIVEEMKV